MTTDNSSAKTLDIITEAIVFGRAGTIPILPALRVAPQKFEGEPHAFVSRNPAGPASLEAPRLIADFIGRRTR